MTIPMVSLDCVSAVMDKSMSVDMAQFGTEMLEEMIEDPESKRKTWNIIRFLSPSNKLNQSNTDD